LTDLRASGGTQENPKKDLKMNKDQLIYDEPITIRINNVRYSTEEPKEMIKVMDKAKIRIIELLKEENRFETYNK
jgi:DNA-directed RNA polymerase subunit E'/Rpb7